VPEDLRAHLERHLETARATAALLEPLEAVARAVTGSFANGGHLYAFGNGGSACDANHLCEELTGRYRRERRPLPAVALTTDAAHMSCVANDYSFEEVFSRSLEALVRPGDVAIGFSTSGQSANVVRALEAARARGAVTVAFTGDKHGGGRAAEVAEHALVVPSPDTARVQEMHILLVHLLCERLDEYALAQPDGD
jgi:D-sedoheptulose 7-phosphate isomerase